MALRTCFSSSTLSLSTVRFLTRSKTPKGSPEGSTTSGFAFLSAAAKKNYFVYRVLSFPSSLLICFQSYNNLVRLFFRLKKEISETKCLMIWMRNVRLKKPEKLSSNPNTFEKLYFFRNFSFILRDLIKKKVQKLFFYLLVDHKLSFWSLHTDQPRWRRSRWTRRRAEGQ